MRVFNTGPTPVSKYRRIPCKCAARCCAGTISSASVFPRTSWRVQPNVVFACEFHSSTRPWESIDPFVSIDSHGRVLEWNSQAKTTFGWTRQEVLGKTLAELIVPAQHRAAHLQGIRRYFETGVGPVLNTRIEITALHRDGHEFPVELTVWPVRAPDGCCFHAFV